MPREHEPDMPMEDLFMHLRALRRGPAVDGLPPAVPFLRSRLAGATDADATTLLRLLAGEYGYAGLAAEEFDVLKPVLEFLTKYEPEPGTRDIRWETDFVTGVPEGVLKDEIERYLAHVSKRRGPRGSSGSAPDAPVPHRPDSRS